MLYLRHCYAYLLPILASLAYRHIALANNEGLGNAAKGIAYLAYYCQWLSARNSLPSSTSNRQPISVHQSSRRYTRAAESSLTKSKTS